MCIFRKVRSRSSEKQFQFTPLSVTNFKIGPKVDVIQEFQLVMILVIIHLSQSLSQIAFQAFCRNSSKCFMSTHLPLNKIYY